MKSDNIMYMDKGTYELIYTSQSRCMVKYPLQDGKGGYMG